MDYINFDAELEDENESSDEEFSLSAKEDNFIDDSTENQAPSFYRFVNQTHDPAEALDDDNGSHLDRQDLQTEMFLAMSREYFEFDNFYDAYKYAEKLKKTLLPFQDGDIKDSFFDAILYGFLG